jgi:hypothetical protein
MSRKIAQGYAADVETPARPTANAPPRLRAATSRLMTRQTAQVIRERLRAVIQATMDEPTSPPEAGIDVDEF